MAQIDDIRIQTTEQVTSMTSPDLLGTIQEIDQREMGSNIWSTISYSSGLVSEINFYSDVAKTKRIIKRVFNRTIGSDFINYLTSMITTFYNTDTTIDSVITTTLSRDVNDRVTGCASSFSTTEPLC